MPTTAEPTYALQLVRPFWTLLRRSPQLPQEMLGGPGGVVRQKMELATVLGIPEERVRVVCGDVGGNYGTRNTFFPEFWHSPRVDRQRL